MSQQKYGWIPALSGVALGLLFLGISDTAQAQTVTLSGTGITNNVLNVTVAHGGISPVIPITVSTTEGSTPTSATVNVQTSVPYLQLQEAPSGNSDVGTPGGSVVLHLTVNATNLTQGTQQSGTVTVTYLGFSSNAVLTVNVTVSGNSLLSASPSSLNFSTIVGTAEANIPTQQLTISSSGAQLGYNVTTSTQNGIFWLVPFQSTGNTGSSGTNTITVGINPAGLTPNTYQGSITVQSTTPSDSVVINVTLVIAPNTALSVTPATLQPFLYQTGTTPLNGQLTQTLQVSSTSASVQFQITMNPQVSWLVISPTSGATGTNGQAVPVSLSVNPGTLSAAVYNTQITVSIIGGASLPAIPVQLVVSNTPLLNLSNTSLSFTSQFAGAAPATQTVQVGTVGSSNTSVGFTFNSDSSWLSATESGPNTPATLTISANPTNLAVGTYTGHLTVQPSGGAYSLTITVNFTVGNTAQVTAGPPLLLFSWETSQAAPLSQVVELFTQGQATAFLLTTSVTASASCPAGWLSASSNSPTTQGATITVSANVTGMTPGMCPGVVTVSYPASSLTPQTLAIPVTVNVSSSTLLNVNFQAGFGTVSATQGGAQVLQTITLTSTDATQVTDVSLSESNAPWLFFGSNRTAHAGDRTGHLQPGRSGSRNLWRKHLDLIL